MVQLKSRQNSVPTGIAGFDDMIEGGFPRGGVITISGPVGSGKTLFALEYLYNGITKFNEPGFYISFDERKRLLYRNVARFGWNMLPLENEKKLVFIEYPIHEASTFISQESALFNMIVELGVERVVIDPITPLTMLFDNEQEKRQGMMTLINTLRSWGCTALLVSELEEGRESTGIEPLCDGVIRLNNIRQKNYRIRALEILKMRGVAHTTKMSPLKFAKEGIEVYPNQFIFD